MFVRNSWYVIAWSEEVGVQKPLGRVVIGEPVVLFRTAEGKAVALEDRCAHRRIQLSLGRITTDGKLICPYHGLTYDGTGACVHVPGQTGPTGIAIRSYPIEERHGLVWIWTGDAEQADPAKIFDLGWLDQPGLHHMKLYRHAKANYMLLNDNLADLLHVAFLHIPSGGGNESMSPAETSLKVDGFKYHFTRRTDDIPVPTGYGRMANTTGRVDRFHIVDFQGPSFHRIHTGVALAGTGGPDSTLPEGQGKWTITPHHFITPETEGSLHYFQIIAHFWAPSSDSWKFANTVVDEDIWAIENQQRNIDLAPDAPFHVIPSDGAMMTLRRIVERMIAAET